MNPTDEIVAKAEDKIDNDPKDPKEDVKDVKEQPKEDKKVDENTTDSKQKGDDKEEKVDKDTTEKDDEGYIADELEEESEGEDDGAGTREPAPVSKSGLAPEQQYIYDNLPEVVTHDKSGKEVRVKTFTELPTGFEFMDQRTQTVFLANMNAQELNARDLRRQFTEQQTTKSSEEFEARENESIKQDIAELQRSGDLPKFKMAPNDPKFATDKATEEAQKVLDYMNERNEQYFKEYQQGRAYRHIGFKEAYEMFRKEKPGEIKTRAEHEEDKERKGVAKDMGGNVGLASSEIKKPVVKSGTSTRDILNRIDNMPE